MSVDLSWMKHIPTGVASDTKLTKAVWEATSRHRVDYPIVRTADIVVAANDAPAWWKLQADFVCDGVADDVPINAAIAALADTGGRVILSSGTFYVIASIDPSKIAGYSRVTIEGQGASTIIATPGIATHLIATSMITNRNMYIRLRDFVLDGTNQTGTSYGIYLFAPSYSFIQDVEIRDCASHGLCLDGDGSFSAVDILVEGCQLHQNGGSGLYTDGYISDMTVVDNTIFWNTSHGIYAGGGGDIIKGNRVYRNSGEGIYSNGWWTIIEGNNVDGNDTAFPGSGSLNCVRLGSGADFSIIKANVLKDSRSTGGVTGYGVLVGAGADSCTIEGNYFADHDTGPVYDGGTGTIKRHNQGYVTENSGASIGTGAQQTIAHGLNFTPTAQQIALIPGTATAAPYHSAAPDATNIYVTAVNLQAWYWGTVG